MTEQKEKCIHQTDLLGECYKCGEIPNSASPEVPEWWLQGTEQCIQANLDRPNGALSNIMQHIRTLVRDEKNQTLEEERSRCASIMGVHESPHTESNCRLCRIENPSTIRSLKTKQNE